MSIVYSDNQVLDRTRNLRLKIVDKLAPEGNIPDNEDNTKLLLNVLNDLDRQALSNKKIETEANTVNTAATATEIIADVFARVNGQRIFEKGDREIPLIEGALCDDVTIVPGELDEVSPETDYNSFMERQMASLQNRKDPVN